MVHQAPVSALEFCPDGTKLATGGSDRMARFWDLQGNAIGAPLPHQDSIMALAFSPDGRSLVAGCENGDVRLWDVATGKPIGPRVQHLKAVQAVAFTSDGKTWLTASSDATAKLWQTPDPWADDVQRINLWLQSATGLELDRASGGILALDAATWRERAKRLQ